MFDSRQLLLTFVTCCLLVLSGCANPGIVEVSPDTYLLVREDHAGVFGSLAKLKAGVIRDANEFAKGQGKIAVPVSSKENPVGNGPAQWARFEYQFRVVDADDPAAVRTNLAREPDEITRNQSTNQVDVTVTHTDRPDVYQELLKLDDLLQKGIITQYEFSEQKAKILSR